MKIFNTQKRFDCFPIPLENSWAWDSQYWEYVVDEHIPSLTAEELELARLSLIRQIARAKELIITEGITEEERKFKQQHKLKQIFNLPEQINLAVKKLAQNAIRLKPNMEGMEQILSSLLREVEIIQRLRTRKQNNEIHSYYEYNKKTAKIILDTKESIKQIAKSLFEKQPDTEQ